MKLHLMVPAINIDPEWFSSCLQPLIGYCAKRGDINLNMTVNGKKANMSIVRESMAAGGLDAINDWSITAPFNGRYDYDYMLWVDSDVYFTPADFERLLKHDKEIVSGVYAYSHGYNERHELLISMSAANIKNELYQQEHGLQPALWFGFGFVLIKRGVFEKIERPWFPTGKVPIAGRQGFCGEDISWCLQARAAGFDLWVDCSLRLPHKKELFIFLPPEVA